MHKSYYIQNYYNFSLINHILKYCPKYCSESYKNQLFSGNCFFDIIFIISYDIALPIIE